MMRVNMMKKGAFAYGVAVIAAGILIPDLRADEVIVQQDFSAPLAEVNWRILAQASDGTVADFSEGNTFAGIDLNSYAYFAPQLSAQVANTPALLFTSNFTAFAVSALLSNTVDVILDNVDARGRFAVKVDGIWYVTATEYTDTRSNPGYAAPFVSRQWAPENPPAAANWRVLENAAAGVAGPLTVGVQPGSDLAGSVSAVGLYLEAGVTPATGGDHLRIDNFKAHYDTVLTSSQGFNNNSNNEIPMQSVGWCAWARRSSDGVITDYSGITGPVGITPTDYAFFAPNVNSGIIANSPALLFASNVTAFAVSTLLSNTVDVILDNTNAKARFAVEVDGSWYVTAAEYTDTRSNPGYTSGNWQPRQWMPENPPAAANWRVLANAATGSVSALSVGVQPAEDLVGDVTAFGLYIDAGNSPAANGDHCRVDNFAVSYAALDAVSQGFSSFTADRPLNAVNWQSLVCTSGSLISAAHYSGVTAISAGGLYAFFAPQSHAGVSNAPALYFADNFQNFRITALRRNTVDVILDNIDAKARFAVKVAGLWYVTATEYEDTRSNPGPNAVWEPRAWTTENPAAAANWRLLENASAGATAPLTIGAQPGQNLAGDITAVGLYIDAGSDPAPTGDHARLDNFKVYRNPYPTGTIIVIQ